MLTAKQADNLAKAQDLTSVLSNISLVVQSADETVKKEHLQSIPALASYASVLSKALLDAYTEQPAEAPQETQEEAEDEEDRPKPAKRRKRRQEPRKPDPREDPEEWEDEQGEDDGLEGEVY